MTTLTEWLAAQLAADEQAAKAATGSNWNTEGVWLLGPAASAHIARHDPARVLATVAALRAVVGLHEPYESYSDPGDFPGLMVLRCGRDTNRWPCEEILAVASVFAGRPGWQEWE